MPLILSATTQNRGHLFMIYENILRLCQEQGMTIRQLETEAGVKPYTIRKWKTSVPRADNLKAVADTLGVTMEALMEGMPGKTGGKEP